MYTQEELDEYLAEIRQRVCTRCVERPEGGPPCGPLGKVCGVEVHLEKFLVAMHQADSPFIDPYRERLETCVCSTCPRQGAEGCPCPLDYLLGLIEQAIETVDQRRGNQAAAGY